jgi:archaellum component FlaC
MAISQKQKRRNKMPVIELTNEELQFAVSMIEFAKTKLQERHDESHSGVDQFLINSWIISTSELQTKFEDALPKVEPQQYDEYQIQAQA